MLRSFAAKDRTPLNTFAAKVRSSEQLDESSLILHIVITVKKCCLMKLLVLSDLHLGFKPMGLEHGGQHIGADADLVILAGDIAEGHKGLRWARESFWDKPILYVAGNHEFYGRHWSGHLREMREKAAALDIAFLEDDVFEFEGMRFLGCSLWTDFELHGSEAKRQAMRAAQEHLNDYARIKISRPKWLGPDIDGNQPSLLSPEFTVRRFQQSVTWLERELNNGHPENTVVVTHHAPHPNSVPAQYVGDALTPAFVSDLQRLMGKAHLWVHGHVHDSFDYLINGTRVVCNPRGYARRDGGTENEKFNPALTIEVDRRHGLPMLKERQRKERQRKDAEEVAAGKRSPCSLLAVGKGDLDGATFTFNPESEFAGPGWTERTVCSRRTGEGR